MTENWKIIKPLPKLKKCTHQNCVLTEEIGSNSEWVIENGIPVDCGTSSMGMPTGRFWIRCSDCDREFEFNTRRVPKWAMALHKSVVERGLGEDVE